MATSKINQDTEKGTVPEVHDDPDKEDPSSKMWGLCLLQAKELDTAMVKRWKAAMDGILIYAGVFSATVAPFVIESYKLLQVDSSAATAQLLRQATQQLAAISNGESLVTPTTTDDSFRPARYAIHVNILWFLSLCLSLSCALLATLVQQWTRRYIRLAETTTTPVRRVRIRTYLFDGMERFHTRWMVENIAFLMHAAIFFFFAGLVEFLFAINDEVATVILVIVCIFGAAYIFLTALPVFYYQCPYQTPLTSLIWHTGHYLGIGALRLFSSSERIRKPYQRLWDEVKMGFHSYVAHIAEEEETLQIDENALKSALASCIDDRQSETFVDAIPGYLKGGKKSYRVQNIQTLLNKAKKDPDHPQLSNKAKKDQDHPQLSNKAKKNQDHWQLSPHLDLLLTSCVDADGSMDKVLRRQRAITCARAIREMSRASADLMTDVRPTICGKLEKLSRDHDPAIRLEALSAIAIAEHALLAHLDEIKDLDKRTKASQVLNALVGERQYHHNHGPGDKRLHIVTNFISSVRALIPLMELSYEDLVAVQMTLERLCDASDWEEFSPEAQSRFTEKLAEVMRGEAEVKLEDQQSSKSPISEFQKAVETATSKLVNALKVEFKDLLPKSALLSHDSSILRL